ncbi:MAG: sigma-70 family RNA polymerase sigma factor [Planctomycetes bacterium]|nr:sigma-70 family RNA polymerase sigma factor [Planctomycetota bacterium]
MSDSRASEVSVCLAAIRAGDPAAVDRLLPHVYADLRELARRVHRGAANATLQPTALVHEAYLRLVGNDGAFNDRVHFMSVAAIAMRQILVDYARNRRAQKRGGDRELVALQDSDAAVDGADVDIVALDDALSRLERLDERQARIVTLRYFGGLTVEETAERVGVSPRTVKADWQMARRWLRRALDGE